MKLALRALFVASSLAISVAVCAGTPSRGTVYLSKLNGVLYRAGYVYDGAGQLTVLQPALVAFLPRGGGTRVLPDARVAVVGAGTVSLLDFARHSGRTSTANVNANAVIEDPVADKIWCGWKDATLSEVPTRPLAPGTPRVLTGDDTVATTLAFAPNGRVFYSTGGELESGALGTIDLNTFTTTRLSSAVFATSVYYDAFSGTLITAGLGRARQFQASPPYTVLSQRDDSGGGENYLGLVPTGDGHYIGTRSGGQARLVLLDMSAGGGLDAPTTLFASTVIGGLDDLSGVAGVDIDLMFADPFEEPIEPTP